MGIYPPQTNTIRAPGSDGSHQTVRIKLIASDGSHQGSASNRPHQVEAVQTLVKQVGAQH